MDKVIIPILTYVGLKVAAVATTACFLIIVEEPKMPICLIEK